MREMDGLPAFLRRLQPSDNDIANRHKETVEMEDKLRLEHWKREGAPGAERAPLPPPLPPLRQDLLAFAASKDRGEWRAALSDPAAEEAMCVTRGL